ncbi:MAG: hypothetical protein HY920_00870 [Elusimicrobia bacterium]|nr:hypothetical protein [Elusimicrobiota bacterium]
MTLRKVWRKEQIRFRRYNGKLPGQPDIDLW